MLDRNKDGAPRSIHDISHDEDMPIERTIYNWLNAHEEFFQLYTRARETQAHMCAAQIIAITDTETDPAKARVRMDARKWYAAKLNAKHYGDKVENTHEVGDKFGSLLGALTGSVIPGHANRDKS